MDRRRFVIALSFCAAAAIPLGCAPKKEEVPTESEAPVPADMEKASKATEKSDE